MIVKNFKALEQGCPNFLPGGPHAVKWTSAGAGCLKKNVLDLHEYTHHPCTTAALIQLASHIVYSQINFTNFTAVLNYLVFYYYNIYLIL